MAEGQGKGPPSEHSPRSCSDQGTLTSAPAPSASSLAPTPPPKTPRQAWGGHTAAEPSTLAPAPPPLLAPGPGSKEVLGWADSGVNSIEFSFGYTLKAKVSWTYSQNG